MTTIKSRKISLSTAAMIWILFLLPRVESTRFTHVPPSVLYVSPGHNASFVWDYYVADRNRDFSSTSPSWSFYTPSGVQQIIAVEDKFDNWKWTISPSTCPARLLSPIRVSKQAKATLVISNVTTADSGTYGCSLQLQDDPDITTKVQLIVTVQPRFIAKPPLTKSITEGQDLSVLCTAVGPPTPNVTWVRIAGHVTKSRGTGSATLRITNIRKDQNGTYECLAWNNPNERPVTAQTMVVVYYQPSIIQDKFLNKVIVNESDSLSIKCDADGYPSPTIKWKTPTGSVHTENVYNIASVSRSDAGTYTCTASNGIGREAVASIRVTVQYSPEIDTSKSNTTSKSWNGNSIRLRCFAAGLPVPRISWYKPINQKVTTGINIIPGGSEVTVLTTTDQGDYGQYKCRATNILGSDEHAINVTQLFPPGPVTITSTEVEASSITVRWTKPADNGGSPVTDYLLKVSTKPPVITVNTHAVITGLKANTQYKVKVYAQNAVGYGGISTKVIETNKIGKPSCPELLTALLEWKESKLSVFLKWTKPDDNGANITMYTTYMKEVKRKAEWIIINGVTDANRLEYRITKNIVYGKTYMFIVTAWNKYGESVKDERGAKIVNTTATKLASSARAIKYCTEEESKTYLIVLGVVIAMLVLSLGFNLLQFLYLSRRAQLSSKKESQSQKRKTPRKAAAGESYENDFELDDRPASSAKASHEQDLAQKGPEYEAIQQPNPDEAGTSSYISSYHGLNMLPNTSNPGAHGPVYEPLRTKCTEPNMEHNDNEQHPYEPLNIRNQNTTYQSLQTNSRESAI